MNARKRPLIAAIGVGIAVAAVLALVLRGRARPMLRLEDRRADRELVLLARELQPRGLVAPEPGASTLVREPLDAATVQRLFPMDSGRTFHPILWFVSTPNQSREERFEEHPRGGFVRRTSSIGLREDHELFSERPEVYVLVTGDSHTDGVCGNDESFCSRLEESLRGEHASVEVLNTAMGGYSFYNYLGALEAFGEPAPDVLVTAFYGGNDFGEALVPFHYFERSAQPPQNAEDVARARAAVDGNTNAFGQGLNSAAYFARFPDEKDLALRAAREVCAEIRARCAARGIDWIVVWIPSVFALPVTRDAPNVRRVREALGLPMEALDFENALGDRLLDELRADGVDVVDLRPIFGSEPGPWYWSELHINVRAHERIAELLLPHVRALLAERQR